jgi:squalene-hopene/tetraprenyl-beta-curcumene cyclase
MKAANFGFTCVAYVATLVFTFATVHAGENKPAGSREKERALAAAKKAAAYLLKQANKDGTFGQAKGREMPGVVGLVVWALAESPEKPRENNCPEIAAAAKYLVGLQTETGSIAIPLMGLENYNTSVSAVALKVLENPAYEPVLEKAKNYILSCQLDENSGYDPEKHKRAFGGIGYGSAKKADVSNTAFGLEALVRLGLPKDSPAFKNAEKFLKRSQDNAETNDTEYMQGSDNTGAFTYGPGESRFGTVKAKSGKMVPKPYASMTYQAVKSLIYCGMTLDDPAMKAAWKWIGENYSVETNPGGEGMQGYFYYVVAFAKAFTAAGQKELTLADGGKVRWSHDLSRHLTALQGADGSFTNPADRWMEGDPVLATAYALLALNLCIADME